MFLQHLLNGITIGGSYALIALGYTLVYGVLKLINFAHGEIYMIGAYLGFILVSVLPSIPFFQAHLVILLLTMLVAGRPFVRPVRLLPGADLLPAAPRAPPSSPP